MLQKPIIIAALFLLTATALKAQQSILFKPSLLPKAMYSNSKDMKMNMTMKADSGAANAAMPNNMVMAMTMNTITTIITGTVDKNNTFPVKLASKTGDVKMTMNGSPLPLNNLPDNAITMYGKYSAKDKLEVDSVVGKKINDSLKTMMTKLFATMQNNVAFPDRPLKVGETFTQDTPFGMPAFGLPQNDIKVSMTYTLLSVAGDIAIFNLVEKMDFNIGEPANGQALKMNIKGTGTGTLSYDISKQFFTAMTNNIDMNFDMDTNGAVIKCRGAVFTTDKTTITAN